MSRTCRSILLPLPALLWLVLLLLLPSLLLLPLGFATRGEYGQVELTWTLDNFRQLAGFSILGWTSDYLVIAARTFILAAVTTLLCLGIAYPLSFLIATFSSRWRFVWLVMLVIPFCTNIVVRTIGLQMLCDPDLPLARLLVWAGLVAQGEWLYPSQVAVYLGLVSTSLPFAVLPIYAGVERLDHSLIEAARDLYASSWSVFRHAIWPQTRAAVSVAAVMTFVPLLGMFVVPDLLGGARVMLLGNVIQQQFGSSRDYPFGAALSLVLILATLGSLALVRRATRQQREQSWAQGGEK